MSFEFILRVLATPSNASADEPPARVLQPNVTSSNALLAGHRLLVIKHGLEEYRLQLTPQRKAHSHQVVCSHAKEPKPRIAAACINPHTRIIIADLIRG